MHTKSVIERAIELAETGVFKDMQAIEQRLSKERYDQPHAFITGALRRQIAAICRDSFRARNQAVR